MLVIMHYALFIIHYAGFGTHSKLSTFWVASDSLWVEPLIVETVQLIELICNVRKRHYTSLHLIITSNMIIS